MGHLEKKKKFNILLSDQNIGQQVFCICKIYIWKIYVLRRSVNWIFI